MTTILMIIFTHTVISQVDQKNCSLIDNGTCPLYIALLVSFGGDYDGRGVIPGVQMAIDQINSDSTMLPGYKLHYILKATQVS